MQLSILSQERTSELFARHGFDDTDVMVAYLLEVTRAGNGAQAPGVALRTR